MKNIPIPVSFLASLSLALLMPGCSKPQDQSPRVEQSAQVEKTPHVEQSAQVEKTPRVEQSARDERTVRVEAVIPQQNSDPISESIIIYDNAQIPGGSGISKGSYTKVDGYRYVNIAVEFQQDSANEAPLSLGVVFAHNPKGKWGSRRYFTYDQNVGGTADPQMITVSGKDCWHGSPHNRSSYIARFPIMAPYLQVFPSNGHGEPRRFSVVLYLTK